MRLRSIRIEIVGKKGLLLVLGVLLSFLQGCYYPPQYIVKVKDMGSVKHDEPGDSWANLFRINQEQREIAETCRNPRILGLFEFTSQGLYVNEAGPDEAAIAEEMARIRSNSAGSEFVMKCTSSTSQSAPPGFHYAGGGKTRSSPLESRVATSTSNIESIRPRSRWKSTLGMSLLYGSMVPFVYGVSGFKDADKVTEADKRIMMPVLISSIAAMTVGLTLFLIDYR